MESRRYTASRGAGGESVFVDVDCGGIMRLYAAWVTFYRRLAQAYRTVYAREQTRAAEVAAELARPKLGGLLDRRHNTGDSPGDVASIALDKLLGDLREVRRHASLALHDLIMADHSDRTEITRRSSIPWTATAIAASCRRACHRNTNSRL